MQNNWFLNVLVKSNFATPTPFGSVSCFVVGICMSNYNLNSFLIHQASYSKGYQWYLMHIEVLGSIRKIGRYPIKVSEVLSNMLFKPLKWWSSSSKLSQFWCFKCFFPKFNRPRLQKGRKISDKLHTASLIRLSWCLGWSESSRHTQPQCWFSHVTTHLWM